MDASTHEDQAAIRWGKDGHRSRRLPTPSRHRWERIAQVRPRNDPRVGAATGAAIGQEVRALEGEAWPRPSCLLVPHLHVDAVGVLMEAQRRQLAVVWLRLIPPGRVVPVGVVALDVGPEYVLSVTVAY